jgi:chemotaxis protein MotB
MAASKRKRKEEGGGGGEGWLATYADMITLLLCFFAILVNPPVSREAILQAISEYFTQISTGSSMTPGQVSPAGNVFLDLPSQSKGKSLADALKKAVTLFNPEIKQELVKVTQDERGIIISFASDMFFNPASARINLEAARTVIYNLSTLLKSEEVGSRKFRIEGHTDASPLDSGGPWVSNWQLSTERALSVLYYLIDYGVPENRMQVAGFGGTMPVSSNSTPEGRAYNRRVDVVIMDEAHL